MIVFLGDNSTNVAITIYSNEFRTIGYNLSLVDASNILEFPNSKPLIENYPQTIGQSISNFI